MGMRVSPGGRSPLGAPCKGGGVNFALFSENATRVKLCLFDSATAQTESKRITLPEKTNQVWHGFPADAKPGQIYGYRIYGPNEPAQGERIVGNTFAVLFNAHDEGVSFRLGARRQRNMRWTCARYQRA